MKLSELKHILENLQEISFRLPDGTQIPSHFHVTEVGAVTKHFIDCGGTIRKESVINFQLWTSNDYDHRLAPQKLKSIISLSERHLNLTDQVIEVEYQGESTIQKFGLDFYNGEFWLTTQQTDCLAKDSCGIEQPASQAEASAACCSPGGGCC
jgi:hypothetical protein